jgi:transcriptional regulator with XRE-family HTH domain
MADRARSLEDRYARRIGSQIREIREARRWTQRDLAGRLEVHAREISRWESGAQLPPFRLLLQLAETLGVEPGDLLGRGSDTRGGLGSRLQAAHRRCGPGARAAAAALFEAVLALLELDEGSMEGLVGALEIIEGASRSRQKREAGRAGP